MQQKNMAAVIFHFCKNHATAILATVASIGVVATSVEGAVATIKAKEIVDEKIHDREEWNAESGILQPPVTKEEIVKDCWKLYIPAAVTGVATISCILAANVITARQQKSLAAAYALLDNGYKAYRKKVSERIGEKEELDLANEVIVEQAQLDDADTGDKITFYDPYADRYFASTLANFNRAVGIVNREMQVNGYASLNDFYRGMGVSMTEEGSVVGWNMEVLLEWLGYAWIDFSLEPTNMGNGEKCYVIESMYVPGMDFLG